MKTVFRNEPKIDADNPSLHGNLSLECGWNYDGEQINFRHIETVALKRDAVLMGVEIFKALESVWKIDPTTTHDVDFDAHIISNPAPAK